MKKRKHNLHYDFDINAILEIDVYGWVKVDADIFRSWTGSRRIDGKDYHGPCYYFLTNVIDDHTKK